MPSGAKKRKAAAKKKKVHNTSSTTNPNHGENDGGELNSPTSENNPNGQDPLVEVKNREDDSSENKFKDTNEEEGNIEVEIASKSKSSNGSGSSSSDSSDDESHVTEKKEGVLESDPIESVPCVESEKISPIVDSIKPVDSILEDAPQVFDEIKNDEKKETPVVVEEHTEQTVIVSEIASNDDLPTSSVVVESVLKENEVEQLSSLVENANLPPKDSVSEINGADHANETDSIGHCDREPPVASPPTTLQKTTSWKSCCGIFELFSGSGRN